MRRRTIPNVIMSTNYGATGRRVATARDSPDSVHTYCTGSETSSSEALHVSFHGTNCGGTFAMALSTGPTSEQ